MINLVQIFQGASLLHMKSSLISLMSRSIFDSFPRSGSKRNISLGSCFLMNIDVLPSVFFKISMDLQDPTFQLVNPFEECKQAPIKTCPNIPKEETVNSSAQLICASLQKQARYEFIFRALTRLLLSSLESSSQVCTPSPEQESN